MYTLPAYVGIMLKKDLVLEMESLKKKAESVKRV
jgi:hypothetical protein